MTTPRRTADPKRFSARPGIAAVECAIVSPLIMLLVLGAIDAGQFANVHQKISDASRDGARYAAKFDTQTVSQVEAAIHSYLEDVFPDESPATLAAAATITVADEYGNPISGGDLTTVPSGSPISASVTFQFDQIRWIGKLDFLGGSQIAATTMMRRE